MSFFQPAANSRPFLKAAFHGFAGSGKTYTAALLAIGLHRHIGSQRPIAMVDTEAASKFLVPLFERSGVELVIKESRSLADVREAMSLCRDGAADILMIDSLSHIWEDYLAAYARKLRRKRLEFQDWGVIKPLWKREFSDPFVRDHYHAILCGRSGYEYGSEINSETGKREIYQKGVKMKVEGETAYEPDLLVQMSIVAHNLGEDKEVWREAMVLKDRSTLIDGKTFKDPAYSDFEPFVTSVLKGKAKASPPEADAAALFPRDDKTGFAERKAREIELDEIQSDLTAVWPGRTKDEQRHKASALSAAYATTAWKKVEAMELHEIRQGRVELSRYLLEHSDSDTDERLLARMREQVAAADAAKVEAGKAAEEPGWM